MTDQIRVNGNLVGWQSLILKLDSERWYGFTALDWDESRERAYGYGMGKHGTPIAVTPGKYTPGVLKAKLHKHTAIQLRAWLAAKASDGKSRGNVKIPITVQVAEGDITSTTEFVDACVTKETNSKAEGTEAPMEDWEFTPLRIITDGTTLYDATAGG